ncbi:hypothetical protein PSTT_07247 [Puccinia striiformis]|uniref:Flavin reductase like domain-containing protein n=1 Tax=Puccinia striiformis TaxID=27350 RepID=A0A2S4VGU1_9BASI|nr:hypothetical protein PSTT_07247 [Puccinia striiformis]
MSHHPPFKQVEQTRPDFDAGHSLRYTKTPQPDWHVGQGLNNAQVPHAEIFRSPGPVETFIPYEDLSPAEMYKLMISSIVPRPIGFCSTLSADGKPNLAPFSYFNAAGSSPPCVMMSCTASGGGDKDTAAAISEPLKNSLSLSSLSPANYTSIDTPSGISEWTLSGLTPEPSTKVKPARVQEAAVNMECELEHLHEMHDPTDPKKLTQVIVIGRIKAWHIKKEVLVDGNTSGPMVAFDKLMPIARLGYAQNFLINFYRKENKKFAVNGLINAIICIVYVSFADRSCSGISYCRALECFELPRPIWKEEKEKEEVKKLLADQDK